jgi:hypothetical protein
VGRVSYRRSRPTSQFTSLAVVNGNPAIAYNIETALDWPTRATTATGAAAADWGADEIVDGSTTEAGHFATMVVVDGQHPAIAYYDITEGACRYAVQF